MNGQHKDIETTITAMYYRYMKPEETIILNVISAMVDFSTSKALQMSRELDAACDRSLLCITKVDQHQEAGLAKMGSHTSHTIPTSSCTLHDGSLWGGDNNSSHSIIDGCESAYITHNTSRTPLSTTGDSRWSVRSGEERDGRPGNTVRTRVRTTAASRRMLAPSP